MKKVLPEQVAAHVSLNSTLKIAKMSKTLVGTVKNHQLGFDVALYSDRRDHIIARHVETGGRGGIFSVPAGAHVKAVVAYGTPIEHTRTGWVEKVGFSLLRFVLISEVFLKISHSSMLFFFVKKLFV